MEEMRYLLNELLKNKTEQALKKTIDLMKIVEEIYEGDFMELCSISFPEAYEENQQEMEEIRQEMHLICNKLVKIKNKRMIY